MHYSSIDFFGLKSQATIPPPKHIENVMNHQDGNTNKHDKTNNNIIRSPLDLLDRNDPFTDQQLLAIEAAEAYYQSPTTTTTATTTASNSSSLNNKRKLPNSVVGLCKPFSLSPYQAAKLRMRYPPMRFGGQIFYGRTAIEVDKAAGDLLQILEAKRREIGQVTVGFDIEWRASFKRGVSPGKTAVMQICGDTNHCYVMHIFHSGIPPSLQSLLEDSTVLKVGVGIGNDAVKVFKEYNVSIKALEDISRLAGRKLDRAKQWSLGSLTEILVSKELQKPSCIRLGNWEANVLSMEQLQYAATDAFSSWHIHQVLKSLPDAIDKEKQRGNGG
ncbi:DNA_pol_A_exo1 domain-containing protein [Cephalotus follicularis]|uniref:3'-5' exonuclease n=1 Tax=Cephalotus follicularis TaxID=3775 RepID=A0A1Q3CPQ4_CEPFO|nr:DNA_pol_A_exo1 domain-containing protein [Cephalotus follicularis]